MSACQAQFEDENTETQSWGSALEVHSLRLFSLNLPYQD